MVQTRRATGADQRWEDRCVNRGPLQIPLGAVDCRRGCRVDLT